MKFYINYDNYGEKIEASNMQEAKILGKWRFYKFFWGESKCLIDVRIAQLDEDTNEEVKVEWISVEVGSDPEPPECVSDEHYSQG